MEEDETAKTSCEANSTEEMEIPEIQFAIIFLVLLFFPSLPLYLSFPLKIQLNSLIYWYVYSIGGNVSGFALDIRLGVQSVATGNAVPFALGVMDSKWLSMNEARSEIKFIDFGKLWLCHSAQNKWRS